MTQSTADSISHLGAPGRPKTSSLRLAKCELRRSTASQRRGLLWLSLLMVLVGCEPAVRVKTASDPSAQFGAVKTFAMLLENKALPSKDTEVDPFVMQRLRQLTYLKLKEYGLVPVAQGEADLLVAVLAHRNQRVDVYPSSSYGFGSPYGYGYGPGFGPYYGSSQTVRTDEGIVAIDLIDRQKQVVVWRGTGVMTVEPDFQETHLRQLVEAILAQSPAQRPGSE